MTEMEIFRKMKSEGITNFCWDNVFFPGAIKKPHMLLDAFRAYLGNFDAVRMTENRGEEALFEKMRGLKDKIHRLI